jgi:hypothetical protein
LTGRDIYPTRLVNLVLPVLLELATKNGTPILMILLFFLLLINPVLLAPLPSDQNGSELNREYNRVLTFPSLKNRARFVVVARSLFKHQFFW